MAFTKFILPALALAGAAIAQSSSSSSSAASSTSSSSSTATNCPQTNNGAFTITSQSDASQLQDCSTFDGSVVIDSTFGGNLQLNGVQQITGNLSATNATQLTSISSDQLNSIGGYFMLTQLTILSNLQMSSLTSVNVINFEALPNLQQLNFDQGVQMATGVRIVNTQLQSLSGLELNSVGAFYVTNNPFLSDFNVNNLASISDYLTVQANAQNLAIEFPNLITAQNMTVGNVSSLSIPSLANVTGAFGLYSNNFQNFSAPNMTTIGNALVFADNSAVTNISMPLLYTVGGGMTIANNSKLTSVLGFPDLKGIGGAGEFIGAFDNFTLPALAEVKGAFTVNSTGPMDCTPFQTDKSKSVIRGNYKCTAAPATTTSSSSSSTSSSSSSSSSSSKKGAAGKGAEVNMAAMGLMGAVFGLFVI